MEQSNNFGGMSEYRQDGRPAPDAATNPLLKPAAEIEVDAGIEVSEESETAPVYGPSKLPSGSTCEICGAEQAEIRINVDGNTLLMESCDGCDTRRWQLAGERIDLQEALNQVGEHSGRRR